MSFGGVPQLKSIEIQSSSKWFQPATQLKKYYVIRLDQCSLLLYGSFTNIGLSGHVSQKSYSHFADKSEFTVKQTEITRYAFSGPG